MRRLVLLLLLAGPAGAADPAGKSYSLFADQVPDKPAAPAEDGAKELGVRFGTTAAGKVTAVRFWKSPGDTGPHVGRVWNGDGKVLAAIEFLKETASGWQEAALKEPVPVAVGNVYLVGVNTNGPFPITVDALGQRLLSGPLFTADGPDNGVFGKDPGRPPGQSYQNSNYFRDVVFRPDDPAAVRVTPPAAGPFRVRGYYTFIPRSPAGGLPFWRDLVDRMAEDGCDTLIHWVAGAYRSKKYPETWQHNKDHENVKADFTRELIDYAHTKGIKVLLGMTPFAYDGVNQYTLTHPDLAATGKDGKPTPEFGIYCWGRSLCPGKAASQEFMLGYAREILFDFYPNADGLFLESSDYSICHGPECGPKHFENEFRFVRQISDELWAKKPNAPIVVYPHYFSGEENHTTEGKSVGAKMPFDPRWSLFFTPHSTKVNRPLIKQAKESLWWDPALIFHGPDKIREGARFARANGFTGYFPSLEAMNYIPTRPEYDGEKWLVNRPQAPYGFGWLPPGGSPFHELLLRVNRFAYREFCRNPDLPMAEFHKRLGRELFGAEATPERVADVMTVHAAFFRERDWFQPSPLAEPLRMREWKATGKLKPEKAAEYRAILAGVRGVSERTAGGAGAVGELHAVARWLLDQWAGENAKLLAVGKP